MISELILQNLYEKCINLNPDERPSFDHICLILKSDFDYITEDVNKEIFQQNVRFNEESDVQFYFIDKTNKTFDFFMFKNIKMHAKIK